MFPGLTFPAGECKLTLEPGFAARHSDSEFIISTVSAKEIVNRPSFKGRLFSTEANAIQLLLMGEKILAQEDCVFVSCWAFFCSSHEQVPGRTYDFAYGEASGLFCTRNTISLSF